jgi:hypothetical protein
MLTHYTKKWAKWFFPYIRLITISGKIWEIEFSWRKIHLVVKDIIPYIGPNLTGFSFQDLPCRYAAIRFIELTDRS